MKTRYSWQQISLHWISAVIIIWGTLSGFYVAIFNPALEFKNLISFVNVSLTTLFIPFFILRVYYAMRHGKPNDDLLNAKEEKLAGYGHFLLYINITLVLITGVFMMDRPINVFDIIEIPQPLHDPSLTMLFNRMHIGFCASLALLVIGHILAVIKHQMQGKPLLRRMR